MSSLNFGPEWIRNLGAKPKAESESSFPPLYSRDEIYSYFTPSPGLPSFLDKEHSVISVDPQPPVHHLPMSDEEKASFASSVNSPLAKRTFSAPQRNPSTGATPPRPRNPVPGRAPGREYSRGFDEPEPDGRSRPWRTMSTSSGFGSRTTNSLSRSYSEAPSHFHSRREPEADPWDDPRDSSGSFDASGAFRAHDTRQDPRQPISREPSAGQEPDLRLQPRGIKARPFQLEDDEGQGKGGPEPYVPPTQRGAEQAQSRQESWGTASAPPATIAPAPVLQGREPSLERPSPGMRPFALVSEEEPASYHPQQAMYSDMMRNPSPHVESAIPSASFELRNRVAPWISSRWVYKDPQGNIRGPYSSQEMQEWFEGRYFPPSLMIRSEEDTAFEALGDVISRIGRSPFVPPPIKTPPLLPGGHGMEGDYFQQKGFRSSPPPANSYPTEDYRHLLHQQPHQAVPWSSAPAHPYGPQSPPPQPQGSPSKMEARPQDYQEYQRMMLSQMQGVSPHIPAEGGASASWTQQFFPQQHQAPQQSPQAQTQYQQYQQYLQQQYIQQLLQQQQQQQQQQQPPQEQLQPYPSQRQQEPQAAAQAEAQVDSANPEPGSKQAAQPDQQEPLAAKAEQSTTPKKEPQQQKGQREEQQPKEQPKTPKQKKAQKDEVKSGEPKQRALSETEEPEASPSSKKQPAPWASPQASSVPTLKEIQKQEEKASEERQRQNLDILKAQQSLEQEAARKESPWAKSDPAWGAQPVSLKDIQEKEKMKKQAETSLVLHLQQQKKAEAEEASKNVQVSSPSVPWKKGQGAAKSFVEIQQEQQKSVAPSVQPEAGTIAPPQGAKQAPAAGPKSWASVTQKTAQLPPASAQAQAAPKAQRTQSQPEQQKASPANPASAPKKAEGESSKKGKPGAESAGSSGGASLSSWCEKELKGVTSYDAATLTSLLLSLDNPKDICDYVAEYMGPGKEAAAKKFAEGLIRKRNGEGSLKGTFSSNMWSPSDPKAGPPPQPKEDEYKTVKAKKGKKGQKVDPNSLGFS